MACYCFTCGGRNGRPILHPLAYEGIKTENDGAVMFFMCPCRSWCFLYGDDAVLADLFYRDDPAFCLFDPCPIFGFPGGQMVERMRVLSVVLDRLKIDCAGFGLHGPLPRDMFLA